jgi:hypothetical protein
MSRNIYLGADVGKALALIPDLPAAAQFMWNQMRKTDFQARAKLLADEINDYQPDVIGIQEATIRRCQKNLSSKKTTVYDFVEIMLTQLSGKYEVAEFENTKAYNPGFSISPIPYLTKVNDPEVFQKIFSQDSAFCGFETGDALIVKKQLQPEVINLGNTEYEATYSIVPTLMTIYRGYTWADIKINGIPIRFITTHLESLWDENKLPNSAKQARRGVIQAAIWYGISTLILNKKNKTSSNTKKAFSSNNSIVTADSPRLKSVKTCDDCKSVFDASMSLITCEKCGGTTFTHAKVDSGFNQESSEEALYRLFSSSQAETMIENPEFKNCPMCAEQIKFAAKKCRFCQHMMQI